MIELDLHCHTKYSRHGEGEVIDYVKSASQKKVKIFGLSEHFPLPEGFVDPWNDSAMLASSLIHYLNDIKEIKAKQEQGSCVPPNLILTGFEVDFIPEFKSGVKNNIEKIDFDYRIGSVHFIKGWSFDFSDEYFRNGLKEKYNGNIKKLVGDYFYLIREMLNSDFCEVVGHLDLIKKFNGEPFYLNESESYYRDGIREILKLIKKRDLVFEVNSAGFDERVKEQYPSEWIIRECHDKKIPVTMGADAHKPSEVTEHFAEMRKMLKRVGYKNLAYFQKRKRMMAKIL